MSTPLETLFALNDAERDLDVVQTWIDHTRVVAATNQTVQLELDRRQADLDDKRVRIELTKRRIASSN